MNAVMYTHITNRGRKVRIIGRREHAKLPVVGVTLGQNGDEHMLLLTEDYHTVMGEKLAEYNPATSWEVDTPAYVSADGKAWGKRHFAMYKNGIAYFWALGKTSFTANGDSSSWSYYKAFNEED